MKRFVRSIVLFILPIIVILAITEIMLRRVPNDYTFKHEQLSRLAPGLRILVLGSSSSFRDVDPAFFPCTAFNAGNISQSFLHDRAILEQHLEELKDLKCVVLLAPYGSLRTDPANSIESWRAKNYVIYHGLPEFGKAPEHFLELLNRPLPDQWKMILDFEVRGIDNRVCDDFGVGRNKAIQSEEQLAISGPVDAKRHTSDHTWRIPVNLAAVEDIILRCAERRIQVVLAVPPALHTYSAAIDQAQFKHDNDLLQGLTAKHANVTYLSYFNDPTFTTVHYADACHLNASGAKVFSQLLAEHVNCE